MYTKHTRQLFTLPNAISIGGFLLVIVGSTQLGTWHGLALVVIGRGADLLDGPLARRTGVTSRLGALLDAALDKLGMLALIVAISVHHMAPTWILIAFIIQNVANTVATAMAERVHPGQDLRPSRAGKYAMAVQNLALGAFIISDTIASAWSPAFFSLGLLASLIGVGVLGLWATVYYVRRIAS